MDVSVIKKIAAIVRDMQLSSIEVEDGTTKIKVCAQPAEARPRPAEAPGACLGGADGSEANKPDVVSDRGVDFNGLATVTSPMVGVFYSAASPDSKPFVSVGDKIKKGDVLCIIEAMKLMNEIVAEQDGEIVDVCAHDGDVVEYGQTLFKIF